MPGAVKNFIGREGFIWWIGVVEDRKDPEQMGRVRVRCFGWHNDDKSQVPTDSLPWAHPVLGPNAPATYTPKEGDYVMGFFMDADNAQNPVVLGVIPGKPKEKPDYQKGFSDPRTDFSTAPQKEAYPLSKKFNEPTNSRLARNRVDGTVIEKRKRALLKGIKSAGGVSWDEPEPKYAPVYPYNYSHETESGHAFELDDTFGKERVNLAHKIGSFMEYDPEGTKVEKIVKDNYSIVMGEDHIYVQGKCSITVVGDCNLKIGGDMNVEVSGGINMAAAGDIKMKGKAIKFESSSDFDIKSGASMKIGGGSKTSVHAGSSVAIGGSSVEISSPLNVSGITNMKATGIDSKGDTHNLSIKGSGAKAEDDPDFAGLATPTPPDIPVAADSGLSVPDLATAAPMATPGATNPIAGASTAGLEEVSVTSKKVSGITSSNIPVLTTATAAISSVKETLALDLPKISLQSAVTGFEDTMNNLAGQVKNLAQDAQSIVQAGCAEVQKLAEAKDLVLNLVQDLVPAIANTATTVVYETGKRLFPSTESVPINN